MKQHSIFTWTTALFIAACSAGGGTGGDGKETETDADTDEVETGTGGLTGAPVTAMGGAEGDPHPLFAAGNSTGLDLDDPCNTAFIWEVGVNAPLHTGSVILHDGTLWELTGHANVDEDGTGWTMEECTPPGDGYCAEQYAWEEVGTCD